MSVTAASAATRLKYLAMGLIKPAKDVTVDVRICSKCGGKIFILPHYRDRTCSPCKRPHLNIVKDQE